MEKPSRQAPCRVMFKKTPEHVRTMKTQSHKQPVMVKDYLALFFGVIDHHFIELGPAGIFEEWFVGYLGRNASRRLASSTLLRRLAVLDSHRRKRIMLVFSLYNIPQGFKQHLTRGRCWSVFFHNFLSFNNLHHGNWDDTPQMIHPGHPRNSLTITGYAERKVQYHGSLQNPRGVPGCEMRMLFNQDDTVFFPSNPEIVFLLVIIDHLQLRNRNMYSPQKNINCELLCKTTEPSGEHPITS